MQDPNRRGASPRWIRRAVQDSLQRLGTGHIDLYQLHRYDWNTGLDETLGALSDLRHEGLTRAFGHSMFPAEKIVEAQWVAQQRGHARFLTEQSRYSILNRRVESSVLPTARRYEMGVLTFSPLANGGSADATSPGTAAPGSVPPCSTSPTRRTPTGGARCSSWARSPLAGMTLPHLATASVRAHPAVTAVIIGPRTPEQLDELIAASEHNLSDDLIDAIDALAAPGTETLRADYLTDAPSLTDPRHRRR